MKEKVICILNNRASLTIGKEYDVLNSNLRSYNKKLALVVVITIINDNGEEMEYTKERFINKSEFRGHKLNQILK